MAGKRKAAAAPAAEDDALGLVVQKQKTGAGSSAALTVAAHSSKPLQKFKPGAHQRTSSLDAPIMLLEGHEDAVTCVEFSPDGSTVATAGADKTLHLWNVRGECENFMMCRGHKNAILGMRWTADGYDLVTCSPDQTLRLWDATSGAQIKTMKGHSSFVNACDVSRGKGEPLVVSGSDDRTWKLWDARVKRAVASVSEEFPITAVALGDDARAVYTGGIGETVRQWDTRALPESGSFETQSRQPLLVLRGHTDLITDVRVSPDGARVLSNSADNSMRIWDARPYCDGDRCAGVFTGHAHAFEKRLLRCAWSPDATRVASGSSCRNVFVWDAETGKIEYKLPGHLGAVHDVGFHPTEPIIASAGADRRVFLGELAE